MKKIAFLFFILFYLFCVNQTFAETIFTCRGKQTATDTRTEYDIALLKLALEKTIEKYGPYKLVPKAGVNIARSLKNAKSGEFCNFFVKQSISKERMAEMGYVRFPVDLGIVGYRVFFVSPKVKDKIKSVKTLDQLRKFTIGQGVGWLDIDILEHNGFKVVTGSSYEGLFQMVAADRFDLFARGTNELFREYESHKKIEGFMYDDAIALYYPLPRFFFTNISNTASIKRIEEGLIAAYNDGSCQKLWKKYYGASVEFVNLKKRKIFRMDNPFLKGVDNSYEKYIYHP